MKFMVTVTFNQKPNDELRSLIPAERSRIKELVAQGVMQNGYMAASRSKIWLIMQGESQDVVQAALESLPLYKFMDVEITSLAEYQFD
jgi:muconolactone delta-isomerase